MKSVVTAAFFALCSLPASAAVVFMDDFSGYGPLDQLNAADSVFLGNWKTTNGTVDYLSHTGGFSGLCPNGGNCVDLDGSTLQAGLFETVMTFAAGTYDVLFQLAGSGRGSSETVTIKFGNVVRSITLGSSSVANQGNFGTDFFGIHVGSGGTTLSFLNQGGDNIGVILKTVVVQTAAVPVPAAGGLLALGLAGLGALRRRNRMA